RRLVAGAGAHEKGEGRGIGVGTRLRDDLQAVVEGVLAKGHVRTQKSKDQNQRTQSCTVRGAKRNAPMVCSGRGRGLHTPYCLYVNSTDASSRLGGAVVYGRRLGARLMPPSGDSLALPVRRSVQLLQLISQVLGSADAVHGVENAG